jgi:hypothetical protein
MVLEDMGFFVSETEKGPLVVAAFLLFVPDEEGEIAF